MAECQIPALCYTRGQAQFQATISQGQQPQTPSHHGDGSAVRNHGALRLELSLVDIQAPEERPQADLLAFGFGHQQAGHDRGHHRLAG
jgi:hypothetical protein